MTSQLVAVILGRSGREVIATDPTVFGIGHLEVKLHDLGLKSELLGFLSGACLRICGGPDSGSLQGNIPRPRAQRGAARNGGRRRD